MRRRRRRLRIYRSSDTHRFALHVKQDQPQQSAGHPIAVAVSPSVRLLAGTCSCNMTLEELAGEHQAFGRYSNTTATAEPGLIGALRAGGAGSVKEIPTQICWWWRRTVLGRSRNSPQAAGSGGHPLTVTAGMGSKTERQRCKHA